MITIQKSLFSFIYVASNTRRHKNVFVIGRETVKKIGEQGMENNENLVFWLAWRWKFDIQQHIEKDWIIEKTMLTQLSRQKKKVYTKLTVVETFMTKKGASQHTIMNF